MLFKIDMTIFLKKMHLLLWEVGLNRQFEVRQQQYKRSKHRRMIQAETWESVEDADSR